ncbi:MAG TPA: hypothetical protein VD973_14660 [Symbiobacteriaceae bacterium]|nr:hypothetical protein [Symbiobacteriaceae bacterium]
MDGVDRELDLWNSLFHDGAILKMQGRVPGDIQVIIEPGLGNRKYFQDPGENFIVVMRNCSACELDRDEGKGPEPVHDLGAVWDEPSLFWVYRKGDFLTFDCVIGYLRVKYEGSDVFLDSGSPVTFEELEQSCRRWWDEWRAYLDKKRST